MDSESQDSDEGVELSPVLGDFIDAYPDDFSYNEECRHTPVVEARIIYVLLPKNVPVSRCTRLQWLLQHLNTTVTVPTILKTNNSCTDLQIISGIPIKTTLCKTNKFLITSRTEVIFLAQSYRFVYCLDMSPSQSTVDFQKGVILLDEILTCFKTSLEGLCQQFTVPGNTLIFQPCIYLTVIVNTPFFMSPAQQVLVKGVQVTTKNLQEIIHLVEVQFHLLENKIAHVSALAHDQMDLQRLQSEGIVGGLFDLPEKEQFSNGVPMVSPDANFVNMLRYSMLAISLLPENSLSNILVITDGVVAMPDSNIMESLLFQLHYDSIAVSFLKVGSPFHPHCSAGYVAYMDLLHFLSQCTLGTCMENVPNTSKESTMEINIYHELFLLWSFHSKNRYSTTHLHYSEFKWGATNTNFLNNKSPVLLSKRQTDENVNASIFLLIARRMREGYTVDAVNYINGFIEVKLSLQWKSFIYIQYNITSEWPITRNVAHFEVQISAPYEFLYDITCLMKKESKSTFRQAVIERFWIRLTQLASNDCGLAQQFTTFQNSNVWYTLPESVRSGIPVFILNTNIIHEGCKLALTPRDVSCPKFVYIWQPICQMDTNSWRKWFHTHKMSLILKHDHPLPKHLHLANSSGRFQVVQCRQAATVLYGLLSKWASFILIDNNTYLKLLHVGHEKPPQWFCIIRVSSKLPCALINIGFLTGTPGYIRQSVLEDLKMQLSLLSYHSSPPKSKENICCTLLQKPLEKFLIRYERMPNDFTTVVFPDGTQPPLTLHSLPPSPFTGTLFTTLSRYLYHRRWIWSATHSSNLRLDYTAISRILNTLTRMRIQEGFNFAHSSSGIITMVLELNMDTCFSCVVQYVLFPPHSAHWGEGELCSSSEEDVEPESDAESELQMVTEVWIEPQYGFVKANNSRISYLNGKPYYDLADIIKQIDASCIHSLLTLEHISLTCQEKNMQRHTVTSRNTKTSCRKDSEGSLIDFPSSLTENGYFLRASTSQRIQHIPFRFDPISILTLCQQTELLFSMFIEAKEKYFYPHHKTTNKANEILMENIQNHMRLVHDHELTISQDESEQFTLHVIKRHRNKSPVSENFCKNTAESANPQWRCFIKGISITHVILTFIPASLKDLKHLVNFDSCNYPHFNFNENESDQASSRRSSCSDVPINAANTLTFPVYVYDCPLSLLVDAYINGVETAEIQNRDVYEDHRYKSEQTVSNEEQQYVRLAEVDDQNASPEPKSEDSDSDSKNSAKQHCKALILLHTKCFTMSLFSALHSELYIHTSDVQAAMDQCEEHVYEIDIAEYILTVCGHLKQHKKPDITIEELQMTTPCIELRPLHRLIEERFSTTLRKAFNPIPTNSEYYYCRNLVSEKNEEKHDSDDEVSNHPSDTVEFNCTDNFQRMDSSETPEVNPLFLHLICTVHYYDEIVNTPVKVLPTCLGEIIGTLKDTIYSFEKSKLRITLDILCLTLPIDVHNVINDFSPKGLRTTSFSSDFQHSGTSPISEKSFISDFKESDPTVYLPDLQKEAIVSLRDEIKWLLVDEIITSLLDVYPTNINRLEYVMKHVSDNAITRSSCIQNVIDLNFVYGCNKSFDRFVEEFSKLKLPPYVLRKENDVYYLAKEPNERKGNDCQTKTNERELDGIEDNVIMQQSVEMLSQMSDTSSLNGSQPGTDGGYEEDVSDDEEDFEWLLHMDNKRPHLPNFWLIMQIEQNSVTIYFHCRFLELPTTLVSHYLAVQRLVSDAVRELCKRVNQSLLLQSLYETRHCHHLLEPDDSYTGAQAMIRNSSFSRLKSMDEASDEYENYPPDLAEANLKFKPGYFSCPVVWETPFILHPRLKTGPGKSGISRGILALKNILDKFSVANRDNMFVYQDKNSNVFYLRLHEDIQGSCCKTSIVKSNEYEHSIVSRSPSIASLPLGQNKSNITQTDAALSSAVSEIRPRVRSFGERETNEPSNEDTLILRVHGVTEAGEDVKCELVQVLQNRLDDAVLEFLSVMLARNAMCPLTPEDVHFLQKPFRSAEIMIRISIQEFALKWLDSYMHYLRQNLLQFLNIPKYTDSRSHFHFKDYSETEQLSNKMKEDNIFIYNQSQNPSSGSIGIACIALAIICRSENPTSDVDESYEHLFKSDNFSKVVSANIINSSDGLPDTYLEFRLWKQGRVNMDNLSQKLRNATSQSVWDIIMEHYLLQSPLCHEDTTNIKSSVLSTNKLIDSNFAAPFLNGEITIFENTALLDLSLSNKNIEIELNTGMQIETRSDSVSSRRRKRVTPLFQRSTTVDETKETANRKSVIALNAFEQGERGILSDVYSSTLQNWLEFGYTLATPSVKKHQVTLTNRHLTNVTVKELQSIVSHLSRENAKAFRCIPHQHNEKCIYVPYAPTNSIQKCLIISRNFEQWKACTAFKGSVDFSELFNVNNIKHTQKFTPSVTSTGIFISRQKILWALIETDKIIIYTYNWSKDNVDKLLDYSTNLGMWLSVRASFLNSVIAQKIGLFHNQPMTRKEFLPLNNPYIGLIGEGDHMVKFPKDRLRRIGSTNATNPPISTLEAFRDCFRNTKYLSMDPVLISTIEMHEIKHCDKKYRESQKKLHAMYQTRTNTTTMQQIQILMQNSRIIHYCHTPLLFSPRWRIKSAATRDHSLIQIEGVVDETGGWHRDLCYTFVSDYKRYLQTLGFTPLVLDNFPKKGGCKTDVFQHDSILYIRKVILGGILLFTVRLDEPFVTTKLYVIECNRLQSTALKAPINRFILTFLDECDRVKILMHLHSFAYDFHLRAIYNYLSNQIENKFNQGYHLTHFLDDFMKYYNKAPNFARNLIYADTLTIRNLMTEGKQLYDYLLTNVAQYNFEVFDMQRDDIKETEYVLVQVTNTHQVSYKDTQDKQHVDDFDMTIIVCNLCSPYVPRDNVLHLKYYLILISRRDIYPKSEVERTLGKFQTVTHVGPALPFNKLEKKSSDLSSNHNKSSDTECETSGSLSSIFDETRAEKRLEEWSGSSLNCATIKQESINYLGYFSSHEQVMRQLILDCAYMTQKQIRNMVAKGMVHCRTHLLWNKLVSCQESIALTYAEFMELKGLAKLENLSDMHPNLGSLLNQPLSWYQGLAKLLLMKYADHNRVYMSTDGNIIHYVILHQRYVGAFMLLSIDSHTSRGDLYAVYREPQKYEESEMCIADRKILLDGFINCVCFYLWSNMI